MARNGSGVFSLPGTYEAVSGETIEAQQHNDPLEDLEQDANTPRPVVAGGSGATTPKGACDNLKAVHFGEAQSLSASQQAQGRANISAALKGHIYGLTLSNNVTDAANDLDISAGEAASTGANPVLMVLASALTKRLDASWAAGTGNGGLDTGSVAGDTWYHVWLIMRPDTGVVDALFSTSPTNPTMPANYTEKRRLGSVVTNGANVIQQFRQSGNEFIWPQMALNVATTEPGTAAILALLSVPDGVQVWAKLNVMVSNTAASRVAALVTSPDQTDTEPQAAANSTVVTGLASTAGAQQCQVVVRTDTSSQVRFRLDASSPTIQFFISTVGWIDPL